MPGLLLVYFLSLCFLSKNTILKIQCIKLLINSPFALFLILRTGTSMYPTSLSRSIQYKLMTPAFRRRCERESICISKIQDRRRHFLFLNKMPLDTANRNHLQIFHALQSILVNYGNKTIVYSNVLIPTVLVPDPI